MLRYRAGADARRILLDGGLTADTLAAFVGPASGPKWLVLGGIDRALLELGLLAGSGSRRPLLVGSSAGGWRVLALASLAPKAAHQGLTAGYVHQIFDAADTPETIGAAYRSMLEELFPAEAIDYLVDHPSVDVALHVSRSRWFKTDHRSAQMFQLLTAAGCGLISSRGPRLVFERLLLHTRPAAISDSFNGRVLPLSRDNLVDAAMATGSVPIYMQPVRNLPGGPKGLYLDGGLIDYHLNHHYGVTEGIVLFPHYRRRIAPGWFDKHLPYRRPSSTVTRNLLQIYPSDEFVARLPSERLPDRRDFTEFADRPEERIRRWRLAVTMAEDLGQELLRDLESGSWVDRLESF